jgi:hypothetical protein
MYACGIMAVQVDGSQQHFVLPEVLAQFRSRLDGAVMEELLAIQGATAMEEGLVSPAHLVVDTFPSEQGSPRVNDAATLYKAQKKSSSSSRPSPPSAPHKAQSWGCRPTNSNKTSKRLCAGSADNAGGWATCL